MNFVNSLKTAFLQITSGQLLHKFVKDHIKNSMTPGKTMFQTPLLYFAKSENSAKKPSTQIIIFCFRKNVLFQKKKC